MEENLQKKFIEHIDNFFVKIETLHKYEINSLKAQVEINKTNLKSLMILIQRQYNDGHIEEEAYKMACLIYSMGHKEAYSLEELTKEE